MKKLKRFMVCAVFLTVLAAVHVLSGTHVYASALSEDEADTRTLTYNALSPELYCTYGPYAINRYTGDIHYFPDYGETFAGGIADDGYAYDEHGMRMNTLTYVKEKYEGQAEDEESDRISFDSVTDIKLYADAVMMESGTHQQISVAYQVTDAGYTVEKAELEKAFAPEDTGYQSLIQTKADGIDQSLSVRSQIDAVTEAVTGLFTYDTAYFYASLDEAVRAGRGVCFHYVRATKDLFDALGIESEPVIGGCKDVTNHAWIKVYDSDEGRWLYLDPTCIDAYGTWNETEYENYLRYYREITTDGILN